MTHARAREAPPAGASPPADRRAALRRLAAVIVPTWGRCVFAVVAISVAFGIAGQAELSGYALVPAIFLCMAPPAGRPRRRVLGASLACVAIAGAVVVAAVLSGSTALVAVGLAVAAFASAFLPRVGPLAASLQTPLLIAFAYSAGQPLGDAAALDRGLAVLAAWPVYVLATAIVLPVRERRLLIPDTAGALRDLASAPQRLRLSLRPADPVFRRGVRLAVAAGTAGLAAGLLDLGRAYWPVFAVIIIFNAPVARDWHRALARVAGTLAGIVVAVPLVALVADHRALALALGLAFLLPGLLLMPINYGAAVGLVTVTVGLLFASGGNQGDFLDYRVEDQLVGAAVALIVGLALWRTQRGGWWTAARETASELARAAVDPKPARHREALVMDLLVLHDETAEGVALRGAERPFAAAWTFTVAATGLVRALTGPEAGPVEDREGLGERLRAVAAACERGVSPAPASAAPPGADAVTQMEQAIATLHAAP
jgi:hypothetical protein